MAQFRTTSDIKKEVLQKSGETTNGNSPYEEQALTYLNKAQQVLIGGGSIFSLKVDESWTWARAKYPIVLELEPAYFSGTISVLANDTGITFSEAPSGSIQGWYIQLTDRRTMYRITQHTALETTASLDSSVVDETGTYGFRAFKLDYELAPAYIYIDFSNDKLDFAEVGTTQLTATLTHGSYTPATFIAHVIARLNAVGTTGLYDGSYDPVLKLFTITSTGSGGKVLSLLGATGTNRRRSALPLLGLDRMDYTGVLSYESTYILNAISRLIEPFRSFNLNYDTQGITCIDPINMDNEYPLGQTSERIPDQFCKVAETNDGTITVRFNAYPQSKTKLLIDWVAQPHDMQDNDASFPVIPRKEIDVLIHAAASMVLFDKEDSKWEMMLKLAGAQLEAMEKKNRSELFRTGKDFGQIIPRADYNDQRRRLRYGYTVNEASPSQVSGMSAESALITRSFTYADFKAAALTKTVTARTLPANRSLFSIIIKHSQAFAGTDITSLLLDVGILGDTTKFINGFDVLQAVSSGAQDSVLVVYYPGQATDIIITATAVGADLNNLNQGALDIYFNESVVT